jgi:histidine phosphatase superfamily protein (branch 1)
MKMTRVFAAAVLGLVLLQAGPAAAEQVFFLVRHAERAEAPAPAPPPSTPAAGQKGAPPHGMMIPGDPPLSAAGEQRAAKLAAMLSASGIKAIYTSEFKRTRQTAAPLAQKLNLKPIMAAAKDPAPLVQQLRQLQGNALIVGHADTVPDIMRQLGVAETVTIGDNDYDNLFVVVRSAAGKATLVRLKY